VSPLCVFAACWVWMCRRSPAAPIDSGSGDSHVLIRSRDGSGDDERADARAGRARTCQERLGVMRGAGRSRYATRDGLP
jgi:hypothetical protein